MIVGIGTDIVEIERIAALQRRHPRFANRILTTAERTVWQRRGACDSYLAKRWAAKEAVLKALGTGLRAGLRFRDIEIGTGAQGQPVIRLTGSCLALAQSLGIVRWHVSLTDERAYAVAFVVAEGA